MITRHIRLVLKQPTFLDVSLPELKPRAIPSGLRGELRSRFRFMFGDDSDLECALFGDAAGHPGSFYIKDNFKFEGIPNHVFRTALDRFTGGAQENRLISEFAIPAGAMIVGEISFNQDLFEHASVFHAMLNALSVSDFFLGKRRAAGYGRCEFEVFNLRSIGKVFISYSKSSITHQEWVRRLADRLCMEGIDVIYDEYELKYGDNLHVFMENAIAQSDKVVIILTPDYCDKVSNRKGGVGYESSMIISELYDDLSKNNKYLPVLREGEAKRSIPTILRPYLFCDMRSDALFEYNFTQLYSAIMGRAKTVRPIHDKF